MLKEYTVFLFQLCNCKYITSIIPGEHYFYFLSYFCREVADSFIANTLYFLQQLWSEYKNGFQTFAVVVKLGCPSKIRASKVKCDCFFILNLKNLL